MLNLIDAYAHFESNSKFSSKSSEHSNICFETSSYLYAMNLEFSISLDFISVLEGSFLISSSKALILSTSIYLKAIEASVKSEHDISNIAFL